MPAPNDTQDLPLGAEIVPLEGQYTPSQVLVQLLKAARSGYAWPTGTSAFESQQNIINLETSVANRVAALNPNSAHSIIVDVSYWAGNNTNSHTAIINVSDDEKLIMQAAITKLCNQGSEQEGLELLCNLPGIRLVIASKIFRFCSPLRGAAVDRHASYFFNSLPVTNNGMTTRFIREWSTGNHTNSRLSIYSQRNYFLNLNEYVGNYLRLLNNIASSMNSLRIRYVCAATNLEKKWTPADIEMAAYYWWAQNGSR